MPLVQQFKHHNMCPDFETGQDAMYETNIIYMFKHLRTYTLICSPHSLYPMLVHSNYQYFYYIFYCTKIMTYSYIVQRYIAFLICDIILHYITLLRHHFTLHHITVTSFCNSIRYLHLMILHTISNAGTYMLVMMCFIYKLAC